MERQPKKLLDPVRDDLRLRHYSLLILTFAVSSFKRELKHLQLWKCAISISKSSQVEGETASETTHITTKPDALEISGDGR